MKFGYFLLNGNMILEKMFCLINIALCQQCWHFGAIRGVVLACLALSFGAAFETHCVKNDSVFLHFLAFQVSNRTTASQLDFCYFQWINHASQTSTDFPKSQFPSCMRGIKIREWCMESKVWLVKFDIHTSTQHQMLMSLKHERFFLQYSNSTTNVIKFAGRE